MGLDWGAAIALLSRLAALPAGDPPLQDAHPLSTLELNLQTGAQPVIDKVRDDQHFQVNG